MAIMDKQPILSLCIPTNGAVEWIRPVIESIYLQAYDNEKFEVVITDNGKNSQLPEYISQLSYPNLRYRQTTDEGFLNLVTCLKDGKGLFCKMINHRACILPGAIEQMVKVIEQYKETKPIIYCVNGFLKGSPVIIECDNLDALIREMYYWCSWSGGIGLWQEDISNIDDVCLNFMFPNASLLFDIRKDTQYVIWNKKYQQMGDDTGKGGYNIFETFGITFVDILNDLRKEGRISLETFVYGKEKMYEYICQLYYQEVLMPTKHTFFVDGAKEYMGVFFSRYDYWKMVLRCGTRAKLAKIKRKFIK